MHTTPVSLLDKLRETDNARAWERFVELYTPFLYYWARRVGLHGEEATDLVQDVFAVLLTKLPSFRYDGTRSFRSWLRTVTLNKWREARRRAARHSLLGGGSELDDLAAPEQDEDPWDAEYRQHVTHRAIELMQTDFEPSSWKACWEVVVAGRPAAAVAAELGLSVGAVYAAKFRVMARLREEFADLLD